MSAQESAETAIHRQVAAAREGFEPRVVARVGSGWVLFGERQFVRGYATILPTVDSQAPSPGGRVTLSHPQRLLRQEADGEERRAESDGPFQDHTARRG